MNDVIPFSTRDEQECIALALHMRERLIGEKLSELDGSAVQSDPERSLPRSHWERELKWIESFKQGGPTDSAFEACPLVVDTYGFKLLPQPDITASRNLPELLQLWVTHSYGEGVGTARNRIHLLCQWVNTLYPGSNWRHDQIYEQYREFANRSEEAERQVRQNTGGTISFATTEGFSQFLFRVAGELGPYSTKSAL